jgi:8-oxo-dGTP pyrophosphatase MutT (NUDIX family)
LEIAVAATERPRAVGFLSYVHADDEADEGKLTEFRTRLEREIQIQTGAAFTIFQDRQDISWGDAWGSVIESSLKSAVFLIPVITPSFFGSPQCRAEFERFLQRERELGRHDLIFPVYYVKCQQLENEKPVDNIAQVISQRQYTDWRDLRFETFGSSKVARRMAELAQNIRVALEGINFGLRESARPESYQALPAVPSPGTTKELHPLSFFPHIQGIGITGVYPSFNDCQEEILRQVRESRNIKIFAQMGKSVLSGAAIIYEALERSQADADIRILHAGTQNPYLSERVALNRSSNYREWREDIGYAVRTGSRLQTRLGGRMELRIHSEGYVWRLFIFDDDAYMQPYLYRSDNARQAPVVKLSRLSPNHPGESGDNPNSLYHMLVTYFDLKWDENAPLHTRIGDMITSGDSSAVAALVDRGGIWVFVVPKRFLALEGEELPFHSIGGKRGNDEDWVGALQREASEEIGARLDIKSSEFTRDITSSAEFDPLTLSDFPRPYCVYKRTRVMDPEVMEPEVLWIVGFEAELSPDITIEPKSEIAAIVYLSQNMLRRTARERITYESIRRAKDGSGIRVQPGIEFDFSRIAIPTGLAALPTFSAQRA